MKTKFEIPTIFALLELTDHQLVFVNLMMRINGYFGKGNTYRLYAADVRFILNADVAYNNVSLDTLLKPFSNLIEGVEVDHETWYITPSWPLRSPKTEVEITADAPIKMYWYLLGRTVGDKFEDENSNTFDKYLVSVRRDIRTGKHTQQIFGSQKGLLEYIQKRELS
jgi:hypothetical protein